MGTIFRILSEHRRAILPLSLLYVACLVTLGPTVRFSQWDVGPHNNPAAGEAMAWMDGRLDLPSRGGDVALYHGKYYNVFPPLWTLVCTVVFKTHLLLIGAPVVFFPILYVSLVAIPIPLLYYLALRRCGASQAWAAVMAFYAIAGTCLWTFGPGCQYGFIYSIQLVVAQTGLALLLFDLFGKQRFWLGGIGVLIATWSRQTCLAYSIPLLYAAWKSPHRARAMMRAGLPLLITIAVPASLNAAKFGSPFETGYRYIFSGLSSETFSKYHGQDGEVQVFSLRYVRRHAYNMWISPPKFDWTTQGMVISGEGAGTGIIYGTPLLVLILVDIKRWWADPLRRIFMLATLPVILALLMYHGPGLGQPGYYRYTLDFTIIWIAVITPWTDGERRRRFSLICLTWSVFYFYMITRAGI